MPRGAAPGERRGGRSKGTPNHIGKDVRELARVYTVDAIEKLASIMKTSDSDQAAVMAADKLLDRGWGKAEQVQKSEMDVNVRYVLEAVPDEQWAIDYAPKRITNGNGSANGGAH